GPGEPLFIQPARVTFDGGRGIRYLTTFTQNHVSDVRPQSLYYVFEGLTDDGSALVYAQFPLDGSFDLATLPLDTSNIEGGVAGLYEREAVYVADVSRELDGIEAGAFTPDLTALDAIIGSLRVR